MSNNRLLLLPCAALAISSCTSGASGILTGPPGINEPAYRQCLSDRGFYHASPGDSTVAAEPTLAQLDNEKPLEFLAQTAKLIVNGLMPSVTYPSNGTSGATQTDESNYPYSEPQPSGWRLNRFLDCYVAPVGPQGVDNRVQDEDVEGRLLRAHILLTLLARYGTELVISHSSPKQTAQAELLLGHVTDAEKALRGASAIMDIGYQGSKNGEGAITLPDATGKISYENGVAVDADRRPLTAAQLARLTWIDPKGKIQYELKWFQFTTRLLRVFQVGVDAERIDAQQTLDRASNLIAAFSGGFSAFTSLLKDGLAGVVTIGKTKLFGDAYLRDARETLNVERLNVVQDDKGFTYTVKPIQDGWKLWDAELLRACKVLATVAKKDDAAGQCVPSSAAPVPKPA